MNWNLTNGNNTLIYDKAIVKCNVGQWPFCHEWIISWGLEF